MNQDPKEFLSSPEAARLMQNKAALQSLLASPEARQLMLLLSRQNGDQLQRAAQQAKQGDPAALSAMLQKLGSTGDGSAALQRMEERLNKA